MRSRTTWASATISRPCCRACSITASTSVSAWPRICSASAPKALGVGGGIDPHGLDLGLGFVEDPVALGLGVGHDRPCSRLRLGGAQAQHLRGVVGHAVGLVLGVAHQLGRLGLGLGSDLRRRLARRLEDPGRLLAEQFGETVLVDVVEARRPGLGLGETGQQVLFGLERAWS
jgi:hypothetical protein